MEDMKHRKWRSEVELRKSAESVLVDQFGIMEERRRELECYAVGENCFRGGLAGKPLAFDVAQSLQCSIEYRCQATVQIFSGEPGWSELLEKSSAYCYWSQLVEYRSVVETAPLSFSNAVGALAECVFWGWLDEARVLANEILFLYRRRRFSDVRLTYSQPLNHWFLRVCFEFFDLSFDGWGQGFHGDDVEDVGREASDVALNLDLLLAHWRDSDVSSLTDGVEWLCEYYVSRTYLVEGREFANDLIAVRLPILILAFFRLRQLCGVPIPQPNHSLFAPNYVFLPKSKPMYSDGVLFSTVSRLRAREIPDLGEVRSNKKSGESRAQVGLWRRIFPFR